MGNSDPAQQSHQLRDHDLLSYIYTNRSTTQKLRFIWENQQYVAAHVCLSLILSVCNYSSSMQSIQ